MEVPYKILEKKIVWRMERREHGPHQYSLITKNIDEE
jgi:hypothetical protein